MTAFVGNNTVNVLGANALIGTNNGNDVVNISNVNDTLIIGTAR